MNKKSSFQSLVASLVIFASASGSAAASTSQPIQPSPNAGALLGHSVYFKVIEKDISETTVDAKRSLETMINKDKAAAAATNASVAAKRRLLAAAQAELASLSSQLRRSLIRQDATIVVAISGAALVTTSIIGRLGMEGTEKLIAGIELAVPNIHGLGSVNGLLTKMKSFVDGLGKFTGRTTVFAAAFGSAATAYLFYCEYEDVQRLAKAVDVALSEVEGMIAAIDYVETPTASPVVK